MSLPPHVYNRKGSSSKASIFRIFCSSFQEVSRLMLIQKCSTFLVNIAILGKWRPPFPRRNASRKGTHPSELPFQDQLIFRGDSLGLPKKMVQRISCRNTVSTRPFMFFLSELQRDIQHADLDAPQRVIEKDRGVSCLTIFFRGSATPLPRCRENVFFLCVCVSPLVFFVSF